MEQEVFLLRLGMLMGEVKMSALQSGDRKSLTSERSSLSKNLEEVIFLCVGLLKGEVKMSPLQSGDRKSLLSEDHRCPRT